MKSKHDCFSAKLYLKEKKYKLNLKLFTPLVY